MILNFPNDFLILNFSQFWKYCWINDSSNSFDWNLVLIKKLKTKNWSILKQRLFARFSKMYVLSLHVKYSICYNHQRMCLFVTKNNHQFVHINTLNFPFPNSTICQIQPLNLFFFTCNTTIFNLCRYYNNFKFSNLIK